VYYSVVRCFVTQNAVYALSDFMANIKSDELTCFLFRGYLSLMFLNLQYKLMFCKLFSSDLNLTHSRLIQTVISVHRETEKRYF